MNKKNTDNLNLINSKICRINNSYQKWAQKNEINFYEYAVLAIMYLDDIDSQKELAEKIQMPKQTINNVILALKEKRYIELIPDEKDKRAKKIIFTEEGLNYAEKILNPLFELDKKIIIEMGKEKYNLLINSLNEYTEKLMKALELE